MSTTYMAKGDSQGNPISIKYITRLEAETLQSTSEFVPGLNYTITDADVPLYGGTEITLTAITPSELSLQGSGLFYCPKYELNGTGYGIWTTYIEAQFFSIVGTFTPGETVTADNGATATYLAEGFLNYVSGDWSSAFTISGATATADVSVFISPSYSIGQIVHWGGKSWTNVNGNIGASVDKYTLDTEWTEISFNPTDYNVYIDEIQYDFGNDMIIYRKDRYNNVVSGSNQVFVEFADSYGYGNPIKDFQWGCGIDTNVYSYVGIKGNQVIDSYFETLNTRAEYIWNNELSQQSYIRNNTFSFSSTIQSNTLSSSSYIQNNALSFSSYIQNNTLSSSSRIQNNTFSFSNISNNTFSSSSYIQNNALSDISNISNNALSDISNISNNALSFSSYIQNNALSSSSYIQNNALSNSSTIQSNTLSSSSSIQNNALSFSSYIRNNTFSFSSYINNNTLSSSSRIQNNTLSNNSFLQFTGGDVVSKTLTKLTMEGNNTNIPITATIVFNQNISKTIFKREDGTSRLQYVNNSDNVVITNVNA